jgi:hypothetical protein
VDRLVVLGCGADHGRAADVDVLDAFLVAGTRGDGCLERVEVHHQQVDRLDAVRRHLPAMLIVLAQPQQAAMDLRVERLDPAVQDLRVPGDLGNIGDRKAGLAKGAGGTAGGKQADASTGQHGRELDETGLVAHRQEGGADRHDVHGTGSRRG